MKRFVHPLHFFRRFARRIRYLVDLAEIVAPQFLKSMPVGNFLICGNTSSLRA
jgi:hypothetical protein